MTTNLCVIEGCDHARYGHGWCQMHYKRWKAHGDALWTPPTWEERFWSYVNKNGPLPAPHTLAAGKGPCWLWTGKSEARGYGTIKINRTIVTAHKCSYMMSIGPVPDGLQIDHLCQVTRCCNPAHLEAVTPRENTLRSNSVSADNARKTHCKHGHEFTPENTYLYAGAAGPKRICRTCTQASQARYLKGRKP